MVLRIPRPSSVFDVAQTVAALPADAIRLLSRLGGLIDQAEMLLARADRLLDSAEQSLAAVNDATRKAEDVVARADATTKNVQQLTQEYAPLAERTAPLVRLFVDELHENEVRAAIKLTDYLPALKDHVENDVMPLLTTLDRVGPDVHELLDVTRDLRQAILGLPGFEFFRRRGEDRDEPDQQS